MGMAGTGKTFLALAAGLEQVLEARAYRRLSVYRPLVAVGRQEVGYLPGDLDEKLQPWMAAVHDNLYSLFRRDDDSPTPGRGGHRAHPAAVDSLLDRGQLEMAAITYLRGRSITDEFVIVDEAQNLELPTLKVILTRMATRLEGRVLRGPLPGRQPLHLPVRRHGRAHREAQGHRPVRARDDGQGVRSPLAELAATTF
jgi:PhoH-like ATPase